MDSFRIDEIARRLLERVPPALRSVQADLESNFRAAHPSVSRVLIHPEPATDNRR